MEFESFLEWCNDISDGLGWHVYPRSTDPSPTWGVSCGHSCRGIFAAHKQDALAIAGMFAEKGKSAWVSMNDRLPEAGENVIVWNNLGVIALAWLNDNGAWEQPGGECYSFPCVTHWMPLPDPPKPHAEVKP